MANVVFELLAKIGLDDKEFNNKLKQDGSALQSWGSKAASIAGGAAKVIGAGIAAAGAATVAIGKQALESYADYEQLVGGVETLFKDSASKVVENAQNAFKTAGLSANDYMKTVTSFSASLLQSLGGDTEKAADYADMAITDMADNANKMGTSIESIQNAYQGFAKQNYTMLDNLKLGYGGTKTEMERLVTDAEGLSDSFEAQRDASGNLALSYADIVDAIHIVQDNMGITGTTAKEASETISGSIAAMKAAWTNLVTGIADDNADIDKLMDDFVDSIETVGKNIIPRIKTIIKGVSKAINVAAKELVPMVVQVIVESLPDLTTAGVELIVALLNGIAQALPQLISAIPGIIEALITALQENWPAIKEAGGKILEALALGMAEMGWYLVTAISDALTAMDEAITAWLVESIDGLINKLSERLKQIIDSVSETFNTMKKDVEEGATAIYDYLTEQYENARNALQTAITARADAIRMYIQNALQTISDFIDTIKSKIQESLQWLYDHTIGKLVELAEGVKERLAMVRQHFQDLIDAAYVWGQDLIYNFAEGIQKMFPHLTKAVGWVTEKISNLLGHSHPKEGPLADDYKWMPDMMKLFAEGIRDNAHLVTDQLESKFDFEKPASNGALMTGGNTTNNYSITVNGIEELEELLRWFESRQVLARMA